MKEKKRTANRPYANMRYSISPRQKEYLEALIQFKNLKQVKDFSEDDRYYFFRILNCKLSVVRINRWIKERIKQYERITSNKDSQ